MHTPYFPTLRSRLAPLGRRALHTLRHVSLPQLEACLGTYLPVHLLSAEDEGTNSRERIYSLRLTFQCFIWQLLKPQTACREVVRQVQALFRLKGWGQVKNGSAYCQARLRLPRERLEKALAQDRSKWWTAPRSNWRIPVRIRNAIRSCHTRSRGAGFLC